MSDPARNAGKRVFVVWDTQIPGLATSLGQLTDAKDKLPGFDVRVPALAGAQGEIARDVVLRGIDEAEIVIAFVDLPNANVGFEIGYALARQKRVKLVRRTESLPNWCGIPPLNGFLVEHTPDARSVRKCIAAAAAIPLVGSPEKGERTALACPHQGSGADAIERVEGLRKDWIHPPEEGWTLKDLPRQLSGAHRVVWLLVEHSGPRDGIENAAASLVAGWAVGHGFELYVWRHSNTRVVADIANRERTWSRLDEFARLADEIDAPPRLTSDVIDTYYAYLRSHHAELVPFFPGMADQALGDVYVEATLSGLAARRNALRAGDRLSWVPPGDRITMRNLLRLPIDPDFDLTGRWLVIGQPGAGKSTACRHLCFAAQDNAERPLPVYVSLARYARERKHPFLIAEDDLRATEIGKHAGELAVRLKSLALTGDRVWLLFDGFDEIPRDKVDANDLLADIKTLARDLPRAKFVVTTRPEAKPDLGATFVAAEIQPLTRDDQRRLLANWEVADPDGLLAYIEQRPTLRAFAENPLMLTNLARLSLEPEGLPLRRAEVFDRTIDLFLKKGYGRNPTPVRNSLAAKEILGELALRLFERGGDSWTDDDVQDAVLDFCNPSNPKWSTRLQQWPGLAGDFLADVSRNSGVFGRKGGPRDPWGFAHRSFGELLAAQALMARGDEEVLARASRLFDPQEAGREQHGDLPIGQWGEIFALACALVRERDKRSMLLEHLHRAGNSVLLRTLTQIDGLPPSESLAFLATLGWNEWDGDDLLRLIARWRSELRSDAEIRDAIWRLVRRGENTARLAHLYYALVHAHLGVERQRFFAECDRPVRNAPFLATARIPPAGETIEFSMGSAEGDGRDNERPQHRVLLSSYLLATTMVTRAQFALFDGRSYVAEELPVAVSWWDAWLYCRWVHADGRLPTEAEWECACRAGTITEFSSGDGEEALRAVGWFKGNAGEYPHAVGHKAANAFGLHDMHGNMTEWCEDWYGAYEPNATRDPSGPLDGPGRVNRGGHFASNAEACRCAFRAHLPPALGLIFSGFRIALPVPRAP